MYKHLQLIRFIRLPVFSGMCSYEDFNYY